MNEEEFILCPYNKSHQIIRYRMPGHMMKCRKNYRGPPLDQCMYNATHLVPMGTMDEHLESCRDYHQFHNTVFEKLADNCRPNK
ncbi:gametocyte-specific factor 1 [Anastrepha obliqua]|uniref:gametocyte-specific factor 1 n=1 Tax=Anastrepha obliqua TaxID=95512 RepID=UPI002409ADBB|nr:gametocyte-specific factor 1 [Anastrepha obliqua]